MSEAADPTPRIDDAAGGPVLWVRVQPRARRDAAVGVHGEALKVALKAPPVDGAANAALLKFLGKLCGVAPSSLELVSGHGARSKRVAFPTLEHGALVQRIQEVLAG